MKKAFPLPYTFINLLSPYLSSFFLFFCLFLFHRLLQHETKEEEAVFGLRFFLEGKRKNRGIEKRQKQRLFSLSVP